MSRGEGNFGFINKDATKLCIAFTESPYIKRENVSDHPGTQPLFVCVKALDK